MKTSTITKIIKAKMTIFNADVLSHFIRALADEIRVSEGKQRTFYYALAGHLTGVSNMSAVESANNLTDVEDEDHITPEEFRCWLLTTFAEFARVMLEMNND